jgi:hypothetical protein
MTAQTSFLNHYVANSVSLKTNFTMDSIIMSLLDVGHLRWR